MTHMNTIYRGQRFPGAFGPSWTTDINRAKSYGPHVFVIEVPADLIPVIEASTAAATAQGLHQPTGRDLYLDEVTYPVLTSLVNTMKEI